LSLDYHDIDIAIRTVLLADLTLSPLVGARIYSRVPQSQLLFPFVRMKQNANDFEAGTMAGTAGDGVTRVWNVDYQFNCFSQLQTNDEASAVLKALCDVLENEANLTAEFASRSMTILAATPRVRAPDFDAGRLTWVGVAEFKFMIQEA